MAVHDCRGGSVFDRSVATQSTGIGTGPNRSRDSFLLLVHETFHKLVASVSCFRAGNFSRGRMDRRYRRPRFAHTDSFRGGYALVWRLLPCVPIPLPLSLPAPPPPSFPQPFRHCASPLT